MNRNAVEWEHNKIQLQSAFSTVCGLSLLQEKTDVNYCN